MVQAYLSGVPDSHLRHVDQELDWDNEGVDRDLNSIADSMLEWETNLTSAFNLTQVDIHDIKVTESSPVLQRYS